MDLEHNLKTWPDSFNAISRGDKRFDIRQDPDNRFKVGDILRFRCFLPQDNYYTGAWLRAKILWLSRGPDWNLPIGTCVLSIEVIETSRL